MKYLLFVTLLSLILALTAAAAAVPSRCLWTAPSGTQYDFSRGTEVTAFSDDMFFYTFSFCQPATNSECSGDSGVGCLLEKDSSGQSLFHFVTARWSEEYAPLNIVENSHGSVTMNFANGQRIGSAFAELTVNGKCGDASSARFEATGSVSKITLHVTSPAICGSSSGLSGGAIFLIVVLASLAAYFIVGFLVCKFYFKQPTIKQSIPHHNFWCSLPGWFVSGVYFVISKTCKKQKQQTFTDEHQDNSYGGVDDV